MFSPLAAFPPVKFFEGALSGWDQHGNVAVQCDQCLVEGREFAFPPAGQLR